MDPEEQMFVETNPEMRVVSVIAGEVKATAMFIGKIVRDAMENFHVEHLTDDQMAVLNPIVRNAIANALGTLDAARQSDDPVLRAGAALSIMLSPPGYGWEDPVYDEEQLKATLRGFGERWIDQLEEATSRSHPWNGS